MATQPDHRFRSAKFAITAHKITDLPPDTGAEVAFVGRSNAGKSTAINALTDHTRLAFVSKTPGRTRDINFFTVSEGRSLVDLPGYGYARVDDGTRERWNDLLGYYLRERQALKGLVVIMDVRRPLTEADRELLDWFAPTGKPVHILLTKADKLSRSQALVALRDCEKALAAAYAWVTAQLFSGRVGTGVEDAAKRVASWLEAA